MRYFQEKSLEDAKTIVIYDKVMEFLLEKALLFLSETSWDVERTLGRFQEWLDKKDGGDRDILNMAETGQWYPSEIVKVFKDRRHAMLELLRLELVSKENADKALVGSADFGNGMIFVPCLWRFGPVSLAALYVTTLLGYAIDLDVGVTKGLLTVNATLFNKLKEVWANSVKDLHPFQRGPTHQGTRHCAQVLDNLYSLYSTVPSIQSDQALDTFEKRAMMSIATAVHDVGKGDLLAYPPPAKDYHARNCAALLLRDAEIFKTDNMDSSCTRLIARIVEMHNAEGQVDSILDLKQDRIQDKALRINDQPVETKNLCALFHLSDVMDTTRHRVSDPAFRVIGGLHPGNSGYYAIQKLVNARKGMIKCSIVRGSLSISVKLSPDPTLQRAARARIAEENADLVKTGAKDVLDRQHWPYKLEEVP